MYNVTGKARARKNIKFAKGLNNFKYLCSDYVEVSVRWEADFKRHSLFEEQAWETKDSIYLFASS